MAHNTLAFYDNVVPLIQPVDLGTTDTATPYVQLKGAHRLAFLVQFGVTTQNATTDIIDVRVECASVETETETAVAFNYRLSSAVTANTWGAVTAATATGAELNYLKEGMSLWVEVDVDTMGTSDYKFARLNIIVNAFTAVFVSVVAFVDARYKKTTMTSVTSAASA
jgi:hypothetical protein